MKLDEFLAEQGVEHFGVKGMHWGDRKAGDHENGAGGSIKETASKTAHKPSGRQPQPLVSAQPSQPASSPDGQLWQ